MIAGISPELARCALTPAERQRLLSRRVMQIIPPAPPRRGRYVSRGVNRTDGLTTVTAKDFVAGKYPPGTSLGDIARKLGLHEGSLRSAVSKYRLMRERASAAA